MYNSRGPTARASSTNNSRRAFRDVTNSTRNADDGAKGGKPVVSKRAAHATLPQSHPTNETENALGLRQVSLEVSNPANPAAAPLSRPGQAVLPRQPSGTSLNRHVRSSSGASNPSSYQHSGQVDNIDERDSDDPLCATDYVQDMYKHFRQKELVTSVRPVYMENQTHINERMRSILVDWLVEVHLKFKLVPETLYLTVNLIDRYLEKREVSRPKLQLVGVTCLLIASKYEEIYPPELRDLVYICDRAYSRNEILEMEEVILKALEYQITIPSAHAFLVRYLKAAHADKKIVQLACYILDGTLQSYNLLHYLPSQLAAAAVFIARRCVGRNSWSPTLLKYAVYCEEEVIPVARAVLAEKSSASPELRAVNKKYTSSRYGGVANTVLVCDF
mmetsp:Transcript_36163/g.73825  ORF Transcript_36163/g.73825 Transcript_36163/m.73825 type:complete len:390 (-) Transcript_36163:365-1534(-)|eukprot:CAMPEP_0183304092 /NCGR_PEP_ID=MMETSP0160_2-20130417/9301_1 /TAXON_ID=2839 ORGANISM="Odontella Sinensis, Strain Grunow 1884" /NCGR_SAMPLE_ID=MMETSP0160_2 /ASSEMBLY_ACC=CAM_ASM_000250 /LENGTH=389 /DNA_ID=CAMNT_0025467081 /DNA_START=213 /DNA_END=1382 /DNA_ORIENTATION=+